jgi:N-acetylmuramoyl-L-alanine amidase
MERTAALALLRTKRSRGLTCVSTWLALSAAILAAQTPHAPMRSVTAIRHWAMSETTRVAVEVSGDFEFRYDRLHNPERVYFDILNSRPRLDSHRFYKTAFDDKLVTGVRVAETIPGVTRIVLDLSGPVEITTSTLTNPDRLMIELRPLAPPAVLTTEVSANPAPVPIPPPETAPAPAPVAPAVITPASSTSAVAAPLASPASKPAAPAAKPPVPAPAPTPALAVETSTPPAAPAKGDAAQVEIPKAARHTSNGSTSLVRALGLKIGRVVIDPGHGGHDQGTTGPKGLLEKDVVLDVALRLGKLIEDRMGAEVVYTRTDDTFIPLEGRTEMANDQKADLFLSIHANSSSVPHISGVETYFLNLPDSHDKDATDVASRENATSQKSVFELQSLIQKITLNDKLQESREFAGRVQASLYAFSARSFPSEKNRGVKKAPFVVLIGAHMPSVLAEIGFLSNPREEVLLRKSDYRQKLAEALYRGVSRYAEGLSHFQVAKAGN